jgi:hypothetical protein
MHIKRCCFGFRWMASIWTALCNIDCYMILYEPEDSSGGRRGNTFSYPECLEKRKGKNNGLFTPERLSL